MGHLVPSGDTDNFVTSVSLSDDGLMLAVGSPVSNETNIYEFNISGVWVQVGMDLNGENLGDTSGASVSISADGLRVAIGAPNNNNESGMSGHARVYEGMEILTDEEIQETVDYWSTTLLGLC